MKHHQLLTLLLTQLLVLPSLLGAEIDLEKPSSKLRRFTSDVIFVVEAGDREKYSKRLPETIIARYHGQANLKAMAEKHLVESCQITGIRRIDEKSPEQTTATIDIYFGTRAELTPVASEKERKITLDRGFTYWTWWNDMKVINRAVIFIVTDELSGDTLEDRYIEQLLGVFGLPARSKEFDESCLSAKEQVMKNLQPLDKAILEFYYRAVPPGTRPSDVDKIFREEWSKKR